MAMLHLLVSQIINPIHELFGIYIYPLANELNLNLKPEFTSRRLEMQLMLSLRPKLWRVIIRKDIALKVG